MNADGPAPARVDRASPADMVQLASDVGPAPMNVGAVLILGPGPGFTPGAAQRLLGERIRAVPRLRRRLLRAPPGCGRPYWADDPGFDPGWHIRQVACPPPGGERALLDLAAAVATEPLPFSRPLWTATVVTGLAAGETGLIIVMHHVLADGIGGLAVLASLVDEACGPPAGGPVPGARAGEPDPGFPRPGPPARTLAADAWAARLRRLRHPGADLRLIRQGIAELGGTRPPRRLPATSLNRPAGPRRRLDVVATDLAAVRDLGHAHGGTVNDVVLAAVAGALRTLLAGRGETVAGVTASVPVSARQSASGSQLGNQAGVMPVTLPASGDVGGRISRIAVITRQRKAAARGASAVLLGPPFRALAAAGVLRWYINRQRIVHTFVTNLRGPAQPLSFGGAAVRSVIPVSQTTGNVPVAFAVLSYAGVLRITVVSDPAALPDADRLVAALRAELAQAPPGPPGPGAG